MPAFYIEYFHICLRLIDITEYTIIHAWHMSKTFIYVLAYTSSLIQTSGRSKRGIQTTGTWASIGVSPLPNIIPQTHVKMPIDINRLVLCTKCIRWKPTLLQQQWNRPLVFEKRNPDGKCYIKQILFFMQRGHYKETQNLMSWNCNLSPCIRFVFGLYVANTNALY